MDEPVVAVAVLVFFFFFFSLFFLFFFFCTAYKATQLSGKVAYRAGGEKSHCQALQADPAD